MSDTVQPVQPTLPVVVDQRLLIACAFGIAVSNSMIFAALSDLQDTYGFGGHALGVISTAGFVSALVVQLFVAPLADRGHPKRLVLAGLAVSALGSLMFAFGSSVAVFVLARALTGASMGAAGPALRALAANLDRERSGERLGRLRSWEMAGYTGGPLLGAMLIDPLGLRAAFLVFAGIAAVAFVMVIPRRLPTLPRTDTSERPSLELVRLRPVRGAMLVSLTVFMTVGVYDSLWDRYMTDRGASNFQVGLSYVTFTIPFIVLATRGGRLADRFGPRRVALAGIACIIPVFFSYGFATTPEMLMALGVLEGAAAAATSPSVLMLMARAAPPGRASAAQGLLGAGDLLTGSVVALIAPALYSVERSEWIFGAVATAMVLSWTLAWWETRAATTAAP